ncbi:MAG TPA: hypothetical protein VNT01_05370 [Symbiobacteriaceae bacterium]|nr:hypothetical protein [Symbiobacteriaceae bacterium]
MRILVHPDELTRLSSELRQVAGQLRAAGARLNDAVHGLEWRTGQKLEVDAHVGAVRQLAERLAGQAEEMARFLTTRADLFRSADGQGLGELGAQVSSFTLLARKWLLGQIQGLEALDVGRWVKWGSSAPLAAAAAVPVMIGGVRQRFPELFGPSGQAGLAAGAPVTAGLTAEAPVTVETDPFWASVGEAPVKSGEFVGQFKAWADRFNAKVEQNWSDDSTDHAGTVGGEALKETYRLTPQKVEELWSFARENHVDPRLLLAILQQEGTGSFNTNPANASAYLDGHGPQPDWNADLKAALQGPILSKLRLYPKAVEGGFTGTWVEWVNWHTPIDSPDFRGASGVYAEDVNWAAGVERAYRSVASINGPSATDPVSAYGDWMAKNGSLFVPNHIQGDFVVKPGLAPGAQRPNLALWHEYPRPEYPGTSLKPRGNFWWFPAPDAFCWHIERR